MLSSPHAQCFGYFSCQRSSQAVGSLRLPGGVTPVVKPSQFDQTIIGDFARARGLENRLDDDRRRHSFSDQYSRHALAPFATRRCRVRSCPMSNQPGHFSCSLWSSDFAVQSGSC